MGQSTLVFALISLILCSYCGKDFVAINRHLWRCKSKHSQNSQRSSNNSGVANDNLNSDENRSQDDTTFQTVESAVTNPEIIICACGKTCKGLVGLRMHQRSCKVIRDLKEGTSTIQHAEPEVNEGRGMIETSNINEQPLLKDAVNLPKSPEQWETANSYFMASLPVAEVTSANIDYCAKNLNNVVYNYFKDTYGTVNKSDESTTRFKEKYKSHSKNALKKALKTLKNNPRADANEVQFVSRLLRSKIDNSKDNHEHSIDHDFEVTRNFWYYVKKFIEKPTKTATSFSKAVCENYFRKVFASAASNRTFEFPDWIPKFNEPSHQFDLSPPTYQQVTRIIKKMKAKGSPCPLDKISIICFKRSPFLRSYVTALCSEIFKSGNIPEAWKRAVTILIYKKGSAEDPENFRPITLECVCLKIFTTILRDKIGSYLRENGYIESHIQKGFVEGMSGTFEHLSHLTYLMREAKKKQRSMYVTLIDLRNAFGLVNHDLIISTLQFHHVPSQVRDMVKHMYTDFYTAIATDSYITDFISVRNGVLQGDCLSPLLFNMIINTFIQRIKDKQFEDVGYKFMQYLSPRHWYQFADDAAVVTGMESHNQLLLNEFSRWCTWAKLSIRIDKCHAFGMKKVKTSSKQILPKLYLNNSLVPPIKTTESFLYLGKYFDFEMSSDQHKTALTEKLKDILQTVDQLPLHPKNKIHIYSRYILPKLSWDLTVSDISVTWVKQVLDPVLKSYIRLWLEIPISGTLDVLSLPKEKLGIGLISVSDRYLQCQVTLRSRLKNSKNQDIRRIHEQTSSGPNLKIDATPTTKEMIKDLRLDKELKIKSLTTQSLIIKAIWSNTLKQMRSAWQKVLQSLPRNIYSFCLRYLNNTLANGTNLLLWGRAENSQCLACKSPQTLGHAVSGCKVHLHQLRYNYRHDSILLNIVNSVSHLANVKIHSDLPGYPSPSIITGSAYRPDIVFVILNKLFIVELTAGFETNILKNTEFKSNRYRSIIADLSLCYDIEYLNLSMGALGTFGHSCKEFKKFFVKIGLEKQEIAYLIVKVINVCIRTTYFIFCKRNSTWEKPELMAW